jgi:choice-of-anchor C domain-containing protein
VPKFRRTTLLLALSTVLVGLTASPASAAPIYGTGFEQPVISPGFRTFNVGEQVSGWSVTSGSVDLVTYWQHAEGSQSLDLNGSGDGTIARSVPAALLTTYKVTYAVAANTEGPPALKTGKVTVNGHQVDTIAVDTAGRSNQNMGWVYRTFYFTNLLSSTSTLGFAGTSGTIWGAVIDDVKVESCLLILCPASASTTNRIP